MFTFCDVLVYMKQNKTQKTLESAQYGLEIIFKLPSLPVFFTTKLINKRLYW